MSENTRDTHFQGFAKLLLKELMGDHSDLTLYTWDEDGIARCEQLITQRAYDLAFHAVSFVNVELHVTDETMEEIPDMTEWPKPE